ncbi:polyphosphate kinase 2 family protein [Ureibacillus aquaedulcis]|uniref:Polyphosphate kinase n=1 Tax=Ureibacillus aquaedulcis TaxID=3058421 RepID=A0ABT8GUF6_9BACL|nr:polyphosphate kinase [Ureibacillus sp. BA0131]MDN4495051.1 polyphosphate kinase [Ureibacillus sp. BA0131]
MQKMENLDLAITMDKKEYKKELEKLQYEMLNIQQYLYKNKIGLIIAFEGMDAAGKGGAIKRLTQTLDPRGFLVHPISAPQAHEKRYHYLHRFWRKLPQYGQIGIFDRSWYGRVLVERVEGFAKPDEWVRAYNEINTFEKLLTDDRYLVIKFWLHVDKDEQLARFNERQTNPMKAWKLTNEDWRNREKFDDYVVCANEMFEKTNTINAPWILVPGNNKHYARIKVLRETIQHVKQAAEQRGLAIPNL